MSRLVPYEELAEVVPDGPPLLMVDRVELIDENHARGVKTVSMDEACFQGHFPGAPIMPGVLQVAAMKQVAGALMLNGGKGDEFLTRVKSINRIKFRKPVLPGDLMLVDVEVIERTDKGTIIFLAKTTVDGSTASQGKIELEYVEPDAAVPRASQLVTPMRKLPNLKDYTSFNIDALMGIIPHRFPFLLIDRILGMNDGRTHVVGIKNVTGNEPLFAGTPMPVFPEYVLVEVAAQAACVVALKIPGNESKLGFFMSIDEAHFAKPVVPGDQVVIDLQLNDRGRFGLASGGLYVGDELAVSCSLKFAILAREDSAMNNQH